MKNNFNKYSTFVISGPESCGKTTLFNALKDHQEFYFLEEQSRLYLDKNGLSYAFDDLLKIAEQQITKEQKSDRPLICDNDLINLYIWSLEKYQKVDEFIVQGIQNYQGDRLYLLCSPDIPWEPDPQRENPFDRDRLFEIHKTVLNEYNLNFQIIEGNHYKRLESARKYLGIEY